VLLHGGVADAPAHRERVANVDAVGELARGRDVVDEIGRDPFRTVVILDVDGAHRVHDLYLTPLFAASRHDAFMHGFIHLHFFVSGYLFTWSVAGADPAPHRSSLRTRLAVLFLAGAAHATLGKLMYGHALPRGAGLAVEEIEAAAKLMCYGGDIAELALAVMLFITWLRMTAGPRRFTLRQGMDEAKEWAR